MSEFSRLLNAARFLTIVPVPDAEALEPDWVPRCAKYFPLVGALVGLLSGGVLLLGSEVWGGALPALVAVAASIAITGAFHEDGLADTADALGGRSPEARLAIMRDSRIGTYGALALGLAVAIKVAALATLTPLAAAAVLLAAHAGGRLAGTTVMASYPYAGASAASKIPYADAPPRRAELAVAALFVALAVLPLALLAPWAAVAGIAAGALASASLARLAQRLFGGHTGDVLGAVDQVFHVVFVATAAAVIV